MDTTAMENGAPEPAYSSRQITVAIDPISLVITECITVTSAMRKHARWAHSSVSAILGGGARQATSDRQSDHARVTSSGSLSPDDDGILAGRWGLRGKKGSSMQDNPLLSAFARLRSDLKSCRDIRAFDTVAILHPFMQVIRSSSTTAPITSLALIAITKMLSYGVIGVGSPKFPHGMQLLSSTVTHCRFEAENTSTDEVVFLRILKLMENMVTGPSGEVLCDQSVCEMMECGLSLCCHLRTTEVLRRSAEISMVTMCQTIFQRLRILDLESDGELQDPAGATKEEMDALNIDSKLNGEKVGEARNLEIRESLSLDIRREKLGTPSQDISRSQIDLTQTMQEDGLTEVRPYSLPSIRELFRVLSDLLDPFDRQHTDTMRVMALRIVNVALEVAGPSIAYQPSLASLAKDTLCRNLFQLVRSENLAILHESLRVAGTLLATCRQVLKLQQELYLAYVVACLHPRVPIPDEPSIDPSLYEGVPQAPRLTKPAPGSQSGRSTPVPVKDRQKLGMEGGSRKPDARESMVESVGALVRIPGFMAELFVNYDCETDRSDLCQDLVGLLSRNAFPDSATWSTTNVPPLCLDSLLSYVQFIADRLDDPATDPHGFPDAEALRQQRSRKGIIMKGASRFNESPKGGIAFLVTQGIIDNPDNPHSVTDFLKGTTRIDKKVLGEFLSKKSNDRILDAFMDRFNFTGQRVDEALRQLLNTFRLPGESQLIERIVTVFSEKYCEKGEPEGVVDKDAVYVLTYAIIMLNTDQHNPNVKTMNRMKYEDFARNLRGVNGGKDFDPLYLQDIYDSIKTREIILPEEHDNKHGFEYAWKELLVKAQTSTDLVLCDTNLYDADMFAATWRPVIATLNYVFLSATDDTVFHRVIAGFDQCARIAAKYRLTECLDHIVASLARISTLATETPPSTALNTEVQAGGRSIMVSKFAVDFGRENKAQLATLVLFRIINGNESAIRDGWQHIIRIILNLFSNSLIPTSLIEFSKILDLPSIPLQSPANVVARNEKPSESGLFSAFTSYVSSVMNDEPPEPNDQEIEATLCTVDCISACRIDEILASISSLPVECLKSLTTSLMAMLPEDSNPRVIVVKPEVPAPVAVRPNGTKVAPTQSPYDPAFVCLLEIATVIAVRDKETVQTLGKGVAEVLQNAVRDAQNLHQVAVSRLCYYLLSLLKASNEHDYLRAPVVLHHISSFNQDLLKSSAQNILKGLLECIKGPIALRNEIAGSPDFWSLLHTLRAFPDGAPLAFRIIDDIANGTPAAITADNYEPAASLLNAFALAGGELPRADHPQGAPPRRGRPIQPLPPPDKRPARSDTVLRGVQAMTLIQSLATRVPSLIEQSQLEAPQAWQTYWHPIFRVLSTHSTNPSRDIRQAAITSLNRCLLSPSLASPAHTEWTNIFPGVLFPLISQLLKPEVSNLDPAGMSDTRVQAAQCVCRIFLHYLTLLAEWDGFVGLWADILSTMEGLLKANPGGELKEALPESLKNIVLVMASADYLVPPPNSEKDPRSELQIKLWDVTENGLKTFLPGLLDEVLPRQNEESKDVEEESASTPTSTAA